MRYRILHFRTDSLQSQSVLNELSNHNVYIYHCDPSMTTGVGLYAKQGQYDYVSDLLNYGQSTHDGRAVDQVYGYGGSKTSLVNFVDSSKIAHLSINVRFSNSAAVDV